jgi:2-polyprenyl-3-methyl-5-hydroxy-6-metoxy-1,4-benzoquinol methylase
MEIDKPPKLAAIAAGVASLWPLHAKYLAKSFTDYGREDLDLLETLADKITQIMGDDSDRYYKSYRWMCEIFNKEAFYFKKFKKYRIRSFEEAEKEVYSNRAFMTKYMEGLLVSQLLWKNHSSSFLFFKKKFLRSVQSDFRYLEIGPGHGLYIAAAAAQEGCVRAVGWDVSVESLRQTAHALARLGVLNKVVLDRQDLHAPTPHQQLDHVFDKVAVCEVLEHLEQPREALIALRRYLAPGALLYVNVPINSPAPDHIYLLRTEKEVRSLFFEAGLTIVDFVMAPLTGYSLDQAIAADLTVNCLILARDTHG